jgi:hypothetical protein
MLFGMSARDPAVADSIPAASLMSMDVVRQRFSDYTGEVLHRFLLKCKQLDSLTLTHTGLGFLPNVGRLPPIRVLYLKSCNSLYKAEEFNSIWDLSRLEYLRIGSDYFHPFLSNAPLVEVAGLKRLEIWHERQRPSEYSQRSFSEQDVLNLLQKTLDHVHSLERLEVGGHVGSLPITAIARHSSLRVLKLRDFAEIKEAQESREYIECNVFKVGASRPPDPFGNNVPFPSISLKSLNLLQESCPLINELDLGVDREQNEVSAYL